MAKYVLALDQGTTSSRAILFNHELPQQRVRSGEIRIELQRSGQAIRKTPASRQW